MTAVVLVVWLVGTWITKFTLGEMAILTPIAVVALGALAGVILLWVKVVRESSTAAGTPAATPPNATVRPRPYRHPSMQDGSWTIEHCDHRDVAALAAALEIGEITASILVRRGLRDPDEARAFLAGERTPHDPFLLGDMAAAVERIRTAIAAGSGSACTATTTSTASAPPRSPS